MEDWQKSFVEKLEQARGRWAKRFEETLDHAIVPVFEELGAFARSNDFNVSTPLRDEGRRSYKFELTENTYVLLVFRSTAVGEFELRCESFVPGSEPVLKKSFGRLADIDPNWARQQFQTALHDFVETLARDPAERFEELVVS